MKLYVLFTSDEWRDYPACLQDDESLWRLANPTTVQYGPFERIETRDGGFTIWGIIWGIDSDDARLELATKPYPDDAWILCNAIGKEQDEPRKYDGLMIGGEK